MEDIEDGKENDKIDERRGKSWFSEDNNTTNEQPQTNPLRLIYSVDDDPSLGMSFLLGLQVRETKILLKLFSNIITLMKDKNISANIIIIIIIITRQND